MNAKEGTHGLLLPAPLVEELEAVLDTIPRGTTKCIDAILARGYTDEWVRVDEKEEVNHDTR